MFGLPQSHLYGTVNVTLEIYFLEQTDRVVGSVRKSCCYIVREANRMAAIVMCVSSCPIHEQIHIHQRYSNQSILL